MSTVTDEMVDKALRAFCAAVPDPEDLDAMPPEEQSAARKAMRAALEAAIGQRDLL